MLTHWFLEHLEQNAALDVDWERRAEGGRLKLVAELGHGWAGRWKQSWMDEGRQLQPEQSSHKQTRVSSRSRQGMKSQS